ncbi:aspartate aminotransferase family protein [Chloroflexota bacterium]
MVRTSSELELMRKESERVMRQYAKLGAAPGIVWEKGEGAILWDVEGKRYIDMSSGFFQCLSLGWGRKELIEAAYEQMKKIAFMATGQYFSSEMAIEYSKELIDVLPGNMKHVVFTNDGTGSNEIAVKIARMYWNAQGQAGKYKVLCLSHSYHGASHFAASLMGFSDSRLPYGIEFPGIVRMPNYHCYKCPFGLNYPSCNLQCAKFVEWTIQQEGENSIACMIAETIQGVGGYIWPCDEYWPMVAKILREHNILLISDEVQNGFCRTGKFWGVNHWNTVPDLLTMGKGINSNYLPLGAVGVGDKVFDVVRGQMLAWGSTSSGNPTVLATGRAALKIYKEEKLDERAAKLGEHIHNRLVKEFLPLPCVDDVMGRGLYQSFAVALNKTTGNKVSQEAQEKAGESICAKLFSKGVIARLEHNRRVAVIPSLIIGEDELDTALDTMRDVMSEVKPV